MRRLVTIPLALLLAATGWAQNVSAPKVLIPLLVKDSHNRPVDGLTTKSLVIRDQKTVVADFGLLRAAQLPLDLGILIDTSKSQRDTTLSEALKRTKDFVNDIVRAGDDRVFFLTFSDKPEATSWLKKEDLAGVSIKAAFGGSTALYDSIAVACKQQVGAPDRLHPSRRVLVLISDGEDNASNMTMSGAESEALKSGVVIFAISTQESPTYGRPYAIRGLEAFATVTGGESFTGLRRTDMPRVFATIKELIEGMYYASYFPPHPTDMVHEVEIKPSSREKFEVTYPRKYAWLR